MVFYVFLLDYIYFLYNNKPVISGGHLCQSSFGPSPFCLRSASDAAKILFSFELFGKHTSKFKI